jgi:hypothetical protein
MGKAGTLTVVGSGQIPEQHLTVSGLDAISKAELVLDFSGSETDFIRESCRGKYRSIMALYKLGGLDQENYDAIKSEVIREVRSGLNVTLVLQGHPRIGVTLSNIFKIENVEPKYIPGISSFDSIINVLEIDPLEEGTILLDANRMLTYGYSIDPCVNTFIYHVCSIGNARTDFENPALRNRADLLQKRLLDFYESLHPVMLVRAASQPAEYFVPAVATVGTVRELLLQVTFESTLFIPAKLPGKDRLNKDFINILLKSQYV